MTPTHLAFAEGEQLIIPIARVHLNRVDSREGACAAHNLGQLLHRGILQADAAQLALIHQRLHGLPCSLQRKLPAHSAAPILITDGTLQEGSFAA